MGLKETNNSVIQFVSGNKLVLEDCSPEEIISGDEFININGNIININNIEYITKQKEYGATA